VGHDTYFGDFLALVNAVFAAANIALGNYSRKVFPLFLYSTFTNMVVILLSIGWVVAFEGGNLGIGMNVLKCWVHPLPTIA
jgi:hypothetical protein